MRRPSLKPSRPFGRCCLLFAARVGLFAGSSGDEAAENRPLADSRGDFDPAGLQFAQVCAARLVSSLVRYPHLWKDALRAIHRPSPDPPQVVCVNGDALRRRLAPSMKAERTPRDPTHCMNLANSRLVSSCVMPGPVSSTEKKRKIGSSLSIGRRSPSHCGGTMGASSAGREDESSTERVTTRMFDPAVKRMAFERRLTIIWVRRAAGAVCGSAF